MSKDRLDRCYKVADLIFLLAEFLLKVCHLISFGLFWSLSFQSRSNKSKYSKVLDLSSRIFIRIL